MPKKENAQHVSKQVHTIGVEKLKCDQPPNLELFDPQLNTEMPPFRQLPPLPTPTTEEKNIQEVNSDIDD
ncbi:hypothetical protein [Oceaniferula flava]|uniref:hypothetical protein n=1 Tax=Oceaniferula flava TaxID=2800421 RepID=UPI0028681350|nr:hypothetical protein [Oceaniferula flavus]